MKLTVNEFDMSRLKRNKTILLVGARGSGKSTLLREINYQLRHQIDYPLAMAGTLSAAKGFREGGICDSQIFNAFDQNLLESLVNQCKYYIEAEKERYVLYEMDDCMYDKKVLKNTAIREIFMNGRHMNITFVNCMQYVMDMSADLRSQVDYVFAFNDVNESTRDKLRREFFGIFPNLKTFTKVMNRCCEKFECLVLDVKGVKGVNEVSDHVFWYKARTDLPDFRVGRKSIWRLNSKYQLTRKERMTRAKAAAERAVIEHMGADKKQAAMERRRLEKEKREQKKREEQEKNRPLSMEDIEKAPNPAAAAGSRARSRQQPPKLDLQPVRHLSVRVGSTSIASRASTLANARRPTQYAPGTRYKRTRTRVNFES